MMRLRRGGCPPPKVLLPERNEITGSSRKSDVKGTRRDRDLGVIVSGPGTNRGSGVNPGTVTSRGAYWPSGLLTGGVVGDISRRRVSTRSDPSCDRARWQPPSRAGRPAGSSAEDSCSPSTFSASRSRRTWPSRCASIGSRLRCRSLRRPLQSPCCWSRAQLRTCGLACTGGVGDLQACPISSESRSPSDLVRYWLSACSMGSRSSAAVPPVSRFRGHSGSSRRS